MDKRLVIILPCLSGILLFLSFPPVNFGVLSFFALIPLLLSLNRTKRLSFLKGYLTGLTFFFCLLFWTKIYHPLALPLLVLILSLYLGLFSYLYSLLTPYPLPFTILAGPFLWTSLEFIRSLGTLGFPWGVIGYTQYKNLPFIQISSITGVFGVSFLIVLINSILTQIINYGLHGFAWIKRLIWVAFLIIVIWYGEGLWVILKSSISKSDLKIAIIQGGFSYDLDWVSNRDKILGRLENLTKKAGRFHPQLIIWPETAVREPIEGDQSLISWLERLAMDNKAFLLVGSPHIEDGERFYNSAFLFSPFRGLINRYDKIHLVPFGEFLPFERFLSFVRYIAPKIGNFSEGKRYTIFQLSNHKLLTKFGVLICFEDIFSDLTRRFVRNGACFMVNITNDVWSRSRVSHYQHFNMCIFRAVENGCFLVRAGNTGISAIINPYGKVERILPIFKKNILIGNISLNSTPTFYTRYGDVFSYSSLGLSLISIIYIFLRRRLKKVDKADEK
ncbi:MAG: apolipoprotein N-acyltransferase [bacterium]|nr:apolipoprotein N-acyltransferase [bacterium]